MITKTLLDSATGDTVGDTVAFNLAGERGLNGVAQVAMGGGSAMRALPGHQSADRLGAYRFLRNGFSSLWISPQKL